MHLVERQTRPQDPGKVRAFTHAVMAVRCNRGQDHSVEVRHQSDSQARVAARDLAGCAWKAARFAHAQAGGALEAELFEGVYAVWKPGMSLTKVLVYDAGRVVISFPFTTLAHSKVKAALLLERHRQRKARQARIDAVRAIR